MDKSLLFFCISMTFIAVTNMILVRIMTSNEKEQQKLEDRIEKLEKEFAKRGSKYGSENADVVLLDEAQQKLEDRIEKLEKELTKGRSK